MMPTKSCVTALQDWPAFCLPLDDVELFVLERFSLTLKEFDLVAIPKDYEEKCVHIKSIPMREYAERIKKYLNDRNMVWYTYPMSFAWEEVMKEVVLQINNRDFAANDCWDAWFGSTQDDAVDEDISDDSEDSGDENYRPPSSDDSGSGTDDEDEDDTDSQDAFETSEEDGSRPDSDSDSGVSWGDLDSEDDGRKRSKAKAKIVVNKQGVAAKRKTRNVVGAKAGNAAKAKPKPKINKLQQGRAFK